MRRNDTVEQKYFEDLETGEIYSIPSRTITETHFMFFSAITGDLHPLHVDKHYTREETSFDGRVAHGMLNTMFTVAGASSLSQHIEETAVAFLRQSSEFLDAVYIGDTIYPELEIVDKDSQESTGVVTLESRVYNQDETLVLRGELELLIERRTDDSG